MSQDLIQFDSNEFSKIKNYTKIKNHIGKNIYTTKTVKNHSIYIHKRKNEIFQD